MSFQNLNLDPVLLRAAEACNFSQPTPIQAQAIPVAIEGRDIMASAQTGTGKTAAFVLPMLQRLMSPPSVPGMGPRALILSPTRELASQITDSIKALCRFTRLRFGAVLGGMPYGPQLRLLSSHVDILVATPGRLIDHMSRGRVDFSRLEVLILDEADRMLDMGFVEDVERVAAAAPADRQTLLFSATLEGSVQRVARKLLNDPVRIEVAGVKERHAAITQRVHQADDMRHKQALLGYLLDDPQVTQAVVFTATKRGADQLAANLTADGHACAALHGDMNQNARRRTLENLRRNKLRILVATDVAARGLDVRGITHVVNFDLPNAAEDYVHRIGRTGRGGATGIAVSLVGPEDWSKLARIERLTGQRVEREIVPGLEPRFPEPRRSSAPRRGYERRPNGGRPNSGRPNGGRPNNNKPQGERRFGTGKPGAAAGRGTANGAPRSTANGAPRSRRPRSDAGFSAKP